MILLVLALVIGLIACFATVEVVRSRGTNWGAVASAVFLWVLVLLLLSDRLGWPL